MTECIPGPAAGPADQGQMLLAAGFGPSWLEPTEGSTPPSWLEPAEGSTPPSWLAPTEGSIPAGVLCSFIGSGLAPNPVFCQSDGLIGSVR